jgi:beta-glucosidase
VPQLYPYQDPSLTTEARIADLLPRMTLEQKVGQMVQADGRKQAAEQVRAQSVGSFLHTLGRETLELQQLAESTGLGIPILFGIDAIHGHGFWPGATVFPTQLALSCSWNVALAETMGRVTAKEMLATGMHWTFSPVLCITRDLRWGRVDETFGEDPYLIGELAKALVRGYQGDKLSAPDSVLACAKHFAGYSETVGGKDATEAELSRRKLMSTFLPPFEAVARAGCRTFMTAYQCIDGVSCVVNRWLLTGLLREQWGFDGMVVTDWDNVGRTHHQQFLYPSIEAAVPDSVRAGNDMIMVTPQFYQAAIDHVRQGRLDEADIDQACRRVLTQKFDLGLFDHKRYPAEGALEVIGSDLHRKPLLDAALQSIVLLKNGSQDGPPMLPLADTVRKIAVLGPNADNTLAQLGDWSFGSGQAGLSTEGHPRELIVTVLDGIRERAASGGVEVSYARCCDVLKDDTEGIAEGVELARQADVAVVVVGDVLEQTGEEKDRSDLELSGGQLPLLQAVKETNTPLVVVLINSKPLCIPWVAEHADAILEAFNPGMLGGRAIAQLVFGDANPAGKLTVSFARQLGSQPVYYQKIPGWHGAKLGTYDDTPLFPFGFGLSYTQFEYQNLSVNPPQVVPGQSVQVSVELRNAGTRAGTEITQLYLNDVYTRLSTPEKILKRFARTALEPGERCRLQFELNTDDLFYPGHNGEPVLEPGRFQVLVGGSSATPDLLQSGFELLSDAPTDRDDPID